jgi:general secretion pathway protein H
MISRSDRNGLQAGFTLIEMIVVIAILSLALVLIGVRGTPVSPATHARAAAEEVAGSLRRARAEALMRNAEIPFTLYLAPGAYTAGTGAPQPLPGDVRLALFTQQDETASGTQGRIRFFPDGSSSGGRISLAGGGRVWWVGVDWLSGRVTLAEKPP